MAEEQQKLSEMNNHEEENPFREGAEVEICLDDPGFRGSWYSAKVLRTAYNKKDDKLFVKYDHITDDDDEPLSEEVDLVLARPIPPRELKRTFFVADEVDAFHRDGWWEGTVIYVVEVSNKRRHAVYFRSTKEQIEFDESELRLHREWVYGTWVPPLKEDDDAAAAAKDYS